MPAQVSEYAAAKHVVLKGDLPIGVDKRSVETWMEPQLFRMDKSTGAAANHPHAAAAAIAAAAAAADDAYSPFPFQHIRSKA